jgi:hypothetical protein
VASGQSLRDAAATAALSERTAARRWADPAFRQRVTELRADMVQRVLGRTTDGMTEAADTLRQLLNSPSHSARLGAARALLELGVKLRENVELEQRLADLESKLLGKERAS